MSACFHMYIFFLTGLLPFGVRLDSTTTMPWSPNPGKAVHLSTRDGRLVMNKSRMLDFLVGNITICSNPQSLRASRNPLFNVAGLWFPATLRESQLMSGRFRSPPNHKTAPLCWFEISAGHCIAVASNLGHYLVVGTLFQQSGSCSCQLRKCWFRFKSKVQPIKYQIFLESQQHSIITIWSTLPQDFIFTGEYLWGVDGIIQPRLSTHDDTWICGLSQIKNFFFLVIGTLKIDNKYPQWCGGGVFYLVASYNDIRMLTPFLLLA